MGALAADVYAYEGSPAPRQISLPASGADTFYRGAIVFIDAATCTAQVVPASGDVAVGVCPYKQVITAADQEVVVMVDGYVWLPLGTGVAVDNAGDPVILDISATQSDNPADFIPEDDAGGGLAAGDISIGSLYRVSSTHMLIKLQPAVYTAAGWKQT